jgi:hypothetical protein
MYAIERDVLVIHLRQPFLDWVNRTVQHAPSVTMEELQNDCTVFLVPERDTFDETMAYVQPFKTRLFEMELESWNRDRSAWPQDRTEELFDTWFELRVHSEVWDLVEGPVLKERSGLPGDLAGTWIVVSSPDFDDDYLRMETIPYVELERDEDEVKGDFQVGLIVGSLWGVVAGDRVRFSFEGMDEMDPVNGAGTIVGEDEQITFTLEFQDGDAFAFECVRENKEDVA